MPRKKETRNPLGSIFPKTVTKNGKKIKVWDVRKRYFDEDLQKWRDKTKRCYSHAEALAALASAKTDLETEKQKVEQEKQAEHTFFELIEYFDKEFVKEAVYIGKRKIGGYRQDLKTIRRHLEEFKTFFGDLVLTKFTYENLRVYAEHLASTPTKFGNLPAASTIHKKLTLLRRLFSVAVQKEWLAGNPFARGESLIQKSAETERNRMLTFEEEARLLAACDSMQEITYKRKLDTRSYKNKFGKIVKLGWSKEEVSATVPTKREHLLTFILLSLDTAMRRGEIYNLKWWQVDFEKRVIYLTKDAAKKTKTGVAGILPLTDRLASELEKVRAKSFRRSPDDLVVGKVDFKRAFASACRAAGIVDLQFRDLRATGATRMMLAGNAGDLVRKITRHTKTETFLNHYTSVDVENARLIGEKLQEFNEIQTSKVKDKVKKKNAA